MDAAADLRDREGTVIKHIGFVTTDGKITSLTKYSKQFNAHDAMQTWLAKTKAYNSAVWTALPPNFSEQRVTFTSGAATDYLLGLPEIVRTHAFDYIRKAPGQIVTAFRQHLSKKKLI